LQPRVAASEPAAQTGRHVVSDRGDTSLAFDVDVGTTSPKRRFPSNNASSLKASII
jgi:hypothetical protein